MSFSKSAPLRAVEVMLKCSLSRLDQITGMNKEALYDEYREWLELDESTVSFDEVFYCNYLGQI